MRRRTTSLLALLIMLATMTLLGASPAGAQHGPEEGHIYAPPADTDGDATGARSNSSARSLSTTPNRSSSPT